MIRWEKQGSRESFYAYSAAVMIGMAHQSEQDKAVWHWQVDMTNNMMGGHKRRSGKVGTKASAMKAVERRWATFMNRAGLRSSEQEQNKKVANLPI